ncbi:MAG: Aldehyde ferredoxin oxidoreductase, partial [Dehalococcoidia bacterium]|nr:Aldehyde ferredoxin oxidoreductase [Dehalococcoidia bacterium]
MPYGWSGQLLRVNLSEGSVSTEPLNMEWARQYIGGR